MAKFKLFEKSSADKKQDKGSKFKEGSKKEEAMDKKVKGFVPFKKKGK